MLIDWFTVVAQVINFLILVWLLKRFLYQPILNAIDAREKRIAAELADADAKEIAARGERDEFERKNAEFDQQFAALMKQSVEVARQERTRLLDQARKDTDDLRNRLNQALGNEQRSLHEALSRRAREEVFAIARQVLSDLADTSLEERITALFLRRLEQLDEVEQAALQSAFKASAGTLLIRSAFSLSAQQCAAIETAIYKVIGNASQLEFEVSADLVSGIELSSNGYKVGWSITEYLTSLANSVESVLQSRLGIEPGTGSLQQADKAGASSAPGRVLNGT